MKAMIENVEKFEAMHGNIKRPWEIQFQTLMGTPTGII